MGLLSRGIFYGIPIAVPKRSLSPSLSTQFGRSLDPSLFGRLILLNRDQEVAPTGPTLPSRRGFQRLVRDAHPTESRFGDRSYRG